MRRYVPYLRDPQMCKGFSPYRREIATVVQEEKQLMRSTDTLFEQVPVKVVEKILKRQQRFAKSDSVGKPKIKKPGKMQGGSNGRSRKSGGSTS